MTTHQVKTTWKENMAFESQLDNHTIRMDTTPPLGDDSGASPKKMLLASLAGCTGIDVSSLLQKMRVPFTHFEMDVEADLTDEHPKVYSEIRITYKVSGPKIDRQKVLKAINLSKEKYCGVSAMLEKNCPIKYNIEITEA